MEETIAKVLAAFDKAGTKWTLVGAHAVGMLTEPRATEDFDFVIEAGKFRSVLDLLEDSFGPLKLHDIGGAVRILGLNVDQIRSTAHELFAQALEHTQSTGTWQIPTPELLIGLKFLSSVNPWRGLQRRRRDVLDLIDIYQAVGPDHLNRECMMAYAAAVYPGAEDEFDRLLERIDRDEPITI